MRHRPNRGSTGIRSSANGYFHIESQVDHPLEKLLGTDAIGAARQQLRNRRLIGRAQARRLRLTDPVGQENLAQEAFQFGSKSRGDFERRVGRLRRRRRHGHRLLSIRKSAGKLW